MNTTLRLLALLLCSPLLAQAEPPVDPIALVGRGEQLLKKGEVEDGVLLLWQAQDRLLAMAGNAARDAAQMAARQLLGQHDPRDQARRDAWASIAKQQVALATAYRSKKWIDTAETRLDVAQRFDPDATGKERDLLAKARQRLEKAAETPKPAPKAEARPEPLSRARARYATDGWREVDGGVEVAAHDTSLTIVREWVTEQDHADHEVVVELRPTTEGADWNAGLGVGLEVRPGSSNYSGYRGHVFHWAADNVYAIDLWQIDGMATKQLGTLQVTPPPLPADGFRLLSIRVMGNVLRVQLDGSPPLTATAPAPVRGFTGLVQGAIALSSCAVHFRNLQVRPLPADEPSDEELRQQQEAERQSAISAGVEAAKALLQKKQAEPAALALRDTLQLVDELEPGVLRDSLRSSIEQMLSQADPLATRRRKCAQDIAGELRRLADGYAADGRPRLALALVLEATAFDPDGTAERLASAQAAVEKWNTDQAIARANELQPPPDDGARLRQWFAGGRLLDSRSTAWQVEGPAANAAAIRAHESTTLMPITGLAQLGKASIAVHMPTVDTGAGFAFACTGPGDYCIAMLGRGKKGLTLSAHRYANGSWTRLAFRAIQIDKWRLDGWFEVTIDKAADKLLVSAAGAQIEVAAKSMAPGAESYGLHATNWSDQPATVEFRAFVPPQ